MPEGDRTRMGGTMRLGSRVTVLRPGSQAFQLYGGEGTEELEVRDSWILISGVGYIRLYLLRFRVLGVILSGCGFWTFR